MILQEGDLSFDFSDAIGGFNFDQMDPSKDNYHGISDMCRVDFVVELDDVCLFVEVKDPKHPRARSEGTEDFLEKLKSGKLGDSIAKKLMDSFVYRWAEKKINKPLHYLCLINIEPGLLPNLTDEISKKLPPQKKPVERWQRSFLENCQIFNIDTWNANFPKWRVSRISGTP
jgi:hypothetical protein